MTSNENDKECKNEQSKQNNQLNNDELKKLLSRIENINSIIDINYSIKHKDLLDRISDGLENIEKYVLSNVIDETIKLTYYYAGEKSNKEESRIKQNIFGKKFVENNKDKIKLFINKKPNPLTEKVLLDIGENEVLIIIYKNLLI